MGPRPNGWNFIRDTLGLVVSLVVLVWLLKHLARSGQESPFIILSLAATVVAFVNAIFAKTHMARGLAVFGGAIAVALFVSEGGIAAYDALRPRERLNAGTPVAEGGFYRDDAELGYGPKPGAIGRSRRFTPERMIFDVTYSVSEEGTRKTKGDPLGPTWLFMGCSRTFGHGVNDDETLPARFAEELGFKANVVNLAFLGYGPHQMLRMLELGRLGGAKAPVQRVVYQAIPFHVARAGGRGIWDLRGPSFVLSGDTVVHTGPFRTAQQARRMQFVWKSVIAKRVMNRWYSDPNIGDDEIERYGRIVERSARIAKEKLGADFTVVFWDLDTPVARRVLARLEQTGLDVVPVSSFIPRKEWPRVHFPLDDHPNPEGHIRLSKGLAEHLRQRSQL